MNPTLDKQKAHKEALKCRWCNRGEETNKFILLMYQEVFQKNPRGDHRRLLGKLGRIFKDYNLQSNYPSVIWLYKQVKTWFPKQSVLFNKSNKEIIRQMLIVKVPFVLILFAQQTVTTYNSLALPIPKNWCRRWTLKAGSHRISSPLMSSSANNLMEILEYGLNRS